jgi:predicted metalloendopeptidase
LTARCPSAAARPGPPWGWSPPAAQRLLDFETELARISWAREQLRDPSTQYNPKDIDGLEATAPKVDWKSFLGSGRVPIRDQYVLQQVSYFEALDDLLASTDLAVLKDYMRFQLISRYAGVLGEPAFEASFNFYSKGLRGVQEPRPAWKRAISNINWSMGELLGQLYVKRHFKPEAKDRMKDLVDNLVAAYGDSIKGLDWMGEETRAQALEKLGTFNPKIGYPDKWRDFSDLEIGTDAVENARAISRFRFESKARKLDEPVDKSEWGMAPQIVNAYYNPLWNEIVFPAAILQPPFFDLEADDAVNYGAIGAVIGHEIGHGFDDQGRKFDSQGRLRDWWTAEDAAAFDKKKEALKAQYDAFTVLDGKPINGEFTSGENIGDLAGLSIAYKAYRRSLNGEEAPVIDGLTGDQRFFMGWAQVWRRLYTDAELARRLTVDPHSPSEARTNVIVRNIPAFYEAFDVKEGDKMYLPPAQRVSIW